jgi:hypothetical protein
VTRHSDSASDLITSVSTPTHQSPQPISRHHSLNLYRSPPRRASLSSAPATCVTAVTLCRAGRPAGRPVYCDHCDGTAPLHHRRIHGAATRLPLLVPPISLDSIRIHGVATRLSLVAPPLSLSLDSRRPPAPLCSRSTHVSWDPPLNISSFSTDRYSDPSSLCRLRPASRSRHVYFCIYIISGLGTVRLG